jgi:hypothetical protein
MMTVRPPSVILAVPVMAERRETLLPESWAVLEMNGYRADKEVGEKVKNNGRLQVREIGN